MSEHSNGTTRPPGETDSAAGERQRLLASGRRRLVLDILNGQSAPVELEELVADVADRLVRTETPDEETMEREALTLHHHHLPKLADIGVLDYDPESQRIDPNEHRHSLLGGTLAPPTAETVALSDPHRRLAVEYLARNERATLEELSTELAARDSRALDATAETIATRLHHHHLPRLDEMALVDYDPVSGVVEASERITGEVSEYLGLSPSG